MIHQGVSVAGMGSIPYMDGVGLVTEGLIVQTTGIVLDPVIAVLSETFRPSLSISHRFASVGVSYRGARLEVTE